MKTSFLVLPEKLLNLQNWQIYIKLALNFLAHKTSAIFQNFLDIILLCFPLQKPSQK